jgi:5-methylcytosine-specific restriction endonuclease McrA
MIRKTPKNFVCEICKKEIPNPRSKKLIRFCSYQCRNKDSKFQEMISENGKKVGEYRRINGHKWGNKISLSKIGKERFDIRKELHPNWKGGRPQCEECGKQLIKYGAKFCKSCSKKGNRCSNWKGGITPINVLIRHSLEYKLWRESVFKRDNFTCIWCGAKSGNGKTIKLNADHIKPFCDYPELRFAIDNGRTLCEECHKKTDTYFNKIGAESRWKPKRKRK